VEVGIVGGTGDEGFGLALRLAKAGHHVTIGSRQLEKGQHAAAEAH
jgi:predicted dinucleotide-binding enzyme